MAGLAICAGSITDGSMVVIFTLSSPLASTEAINFGEKARAGTGAFRRLVSALTAVAALSGSPFWNFTPLRSLNSQTLGSVCFQLSARLASSFMS
ncbi:hypothetical protein D3C87_1408780 [compost metagenome]